MTAEMDTKKKAASSKSAERNSQIIHLAETSAQQPEAVTQVTSPSDEAPQTAAQITIASNKEPAVATEVATSSDAAPETATPIATYPTEEPGIVTQVTSPSDAEQPKGTTEVTPSSDEATEAASPIASARAEQPDIVTRVTILSEEEKVAVFQEATQFIGAVDKRIIKNKQEIKKLAEDHEEATEVEGYEAIREMMRVAECFRISDGTIDMSALKEFLKKQIGKEPEATGVENPWQPLAKYCSHKDTPPGLVTKRGYVLNVAFATGIRSDQIVGKLLEEEVVDGRKKRGINKYILMYQLRRLEAMSPQARETEFIDKKFKGWEREEYRITAHHFINQLYSWGLLRPGVDPSNLIALD